MVVLFYTKAAQAVVVLALARVKAALYTYVAMCMQAGLGSNGMPAAGLSK